ncbi:MAG: ABC transporter permease [Lachnospiraceae bacterium]|nr:ABC transporter permease [Lachnospiraceae bacterium]MDY4968962.1 ABC transporter permease [Lachnospiraceae bacterium]
MSNNGSAVSIKEQNKSAASSLMKKNIRKFMNNRLALFGLIVIVVMTVACVAGAIVGVDYNTPNPTILKQAPSSEHIFGTDTIGRDLFARVLYGGCYSILIGVFCSVLSSVIGAVLGAIAGYFGGKVDSLIIRISEIFQAFPQLVLVMMLVALMNKRGLGNLLFIFVVTGWMTTFRMVRNEFMSLKTETYVKVCEAFGMSKSSIMFKQILPNVMSPIIVSTTTNVAFFILQEAALSFIGLGVADSTPTWGNILNAAKSVSVVTNQWWIWVFPGLAISLFVLAINFFGDGLRDVLDPKQQ